MSSESSQEASTADVLLFITASNASFKTVNDFLLVTGDIDAGPECDYRYHVLLHRNPDDITDTILATRAGDLNQANFDNHWKGASILEVQEFALSLRNDDDSYIILIMDDRACEEQTIILAEQYLPHSGEGMSAITVLEAEDPYKKIRLPWTHLRPYVSMLCIGHASFETFTEEHYAGTIPSGGWYVYRNVYMNEERIAEERRGRAAEQKHLLERGLI